ncbi:MAG: DNA topoisomerase IV subunit A, partial [Treponema sp.]|nr:DNA topoisomerase IV subunit A [Treponema sp.]
DDVDSLLKIPIRRISLFDINKNRDQVTAINARLKEIAKRLKHLTDCAIEYLDAMLAKFKPEDLERRTQIAKFTSVDAKAIVKRDIPLRYDGAKGYLGTSVFGGQELLKVTRFDRIFIMRKSGIYTVCDVPDRLFVDTGMWYCNYADKEIISNVLFTVIYRDMKTKQCYIKKCRIPSWIMNRDYMLAPEGTEVLHVDTREKFEFTLHYVKKPRIKIKEEVFNSADFEEKGHKAQGVRLSTQETDSVEIQKDGELDLDGQ